MPDQDKRTERARQGRWTIVDRSAGQDGDGRTIWTLHNGEKDSRYAVYQWQDRASYDESTTDHPAVVDPDGQWWSCDCPDFAGIPGRKAGNWQRGLRCKHIEAIRLHTGGEQMDITLASTESGAGEAAAAAPIPSTGGQHMSSNGKIQTLEGYSPEEAFQILATPLPPECYKPVPGGADLTDIDPIARDVVMNRVFGPCGVGWAYGYDQITVEPFTRKGGSSAFQAFIPKLELRVRWVVDGEQVWSEPIPVAGSSTNSQAGYAAKGAATRAITGAASRLGFQQLVFQGKLTERTAKAAYAKYGPHPFEQAIMSAMLVGHSSTDKPLRKESSGDPGAKSDDGAEAKAASDEQKGYIRRLLTQLGYKGREDEALTKNGLPRLSEMTHKQAGAAIARLKKAAANKKQEARAEGEEQAAGTEVKQVFALLAQLGYTGENARQALTSRGYDPDRMSSEVASAIIEKLQAQVDVHAQAQTRAA